MHLFYMEYIKHFFFFQNFLNEVSIILFRILDVSPREIRRILSHEHCSVRQIFEQPV